MRHISKYRVELVLVEDLLGTVPKNRDVYTRHVQNKAREHMERDAKKGVPHTNGDAADAQSITALLEQEPETIEEVEEKGWTGFHADENGPFLYDYAVRGFLNESARTMREYDPSKVAGDEGEEDSESDKKKKGVVKQLQDKFKRHVFVRPRKIHFGIEAGVELACIERPLRAQTAQGPRVTVVRSDLVPAGTKVGFYLHVFSGGGITAAIIRDVLEYGGYQGLGQWRSGGYGRFEVALLERV